MNLWSLAHKRAEEAGPVRVGVIGAGKFGSMFLTQALTSAWLHVVAVADLDVARGRSALMRTGWPAERYSCRDIAEAVTSGGTAVTDDTGALLDSDHIEVIVEATGNPVAGTYHAVRAIDAGHHVVMVNVEGDCLIGPLLAERARRAGVVYSLAYGDQPALICEMVDWCRTIGFDVVAAGKGTKYLPEYHLSTPDTVWDYYGFSTEQLAAGDFNPKIFNSFLDGTKSAIEMAAVANATGLVPPSAGLNFVPCGADDLPSVFRPVADGGALELRGSVEVASSLNRDGSLVARDLRWGVYVTFEATTAYAQRCFAEYGLKTDSTGRFGALYRPYHLIGLELGVSIASAAIRREPTGAPGGFVGDVMSVTKRALKSGEILDGEGGYTVYGRLAPAQTSLRNKALPIGLAHGCRVVRDLAADVIVSWHDVEVEDITLAAELRRDLERAGSSDRDRAVGSVALP